MSRETFEMSLVVLREIDLLLRCVEQALQLAREVDELIVSGLLRVREQFLDARGVLLMQMQRGVVSTG